MYSVQFMYMYRVCICSVCICTVYVHVQCMYTYNFTTVFYCTTWAVKKVDNKIIRGKIDMKCNSQLRERCGYFLQISTK